MVCWGVLIFVAGVQRKCKCLWSWIGEREKIADAFVSPNSPAKCDLLSPIFFAISKELNIEWLWHIFLWHKNERDLLKSKRS